MNLILPFTVNRGVYRPELTVMLSNLKTGRTLAINALIDSGADVTVFPMVFFEALGIDCKSEAISTSQIIGVAGQSYKVWQIKMDIWILKENSDEPFYHARNVLIDCVDAKDSHILLGTNFFNPEFKVTLDYTNKMVMLEC